MFAAAAAACLGRRYSRARAPNDIDKAPRRRRFRFSRAPIFGGSGQLAAIPPTGSLAGGLHCALIGIQRSASAESRAAPKLERRLEQASLVDGAFLCKLISRDSENMSSRKRCALESMLCVVNYVRRPPSRSAPSPAQARPGRRAH